MPSGSIDVHHFAGTRHGIAGRRVSVWMPAGYGRDPDQRFPVLYLQDGQNLFDPAIAFGGIAWRADATAQRCIDAARIAPLLLVGIDNSGAHRTDDYTPTRWRGRGGHADDFAAMLALAIVPFVDRHYRTQPGPRTTGVGGASLGGLLALHAGLRHPGVFGHIAAMSPSLFWGDGELLRAVAALPRKLPIRIWLDAGTKEPEPLRRAVRRLAEVLVAKGWQQHRQARRADLRHVEVPRGRHDESSWGRRFDRVLKFLFPRPAAATRTARTPRPSGQSPASAPVSAGQRSRS